VIETLYNKFAFPDAAYLGKRVFKTLFHEHAALTAADKSALTDDVDTIVWQYTLKPGTFPVVPFVDDQREYLEVAVIQVGLKTQKRTARINEVIHRAIPYPVVIVFVFGSQFAMGVAHKRFHQSQKNQIVAEDIGLTEWIDLSSPSPVQAAFLESLKLLTLPSSHFLSVYTGLVDRIVALECARLSNVFRVENAADQREARRQRLIACHDLELQLADRRAAAKRESQVNRLVALNLEIKRMEGDLQRIAQGLA